MARKELAPNLMIEAIARGVLLLEERGSTVYFRLFNNECSVSGPLVRRRDWSDTFGRPGLIPLIETVQQNGEHACSEAPSEITEDILAVVYDFLKQRLNPEKLFFFDSDRGWMLSSIGSKPLAASPLKQN